MLGRIGHQKQPVEDPTIALLRSELLSILADWGMDPVALQLCDSLTFVYLTNPSDVDPDLADAALASSARGGDEALFRRYTAALESAVSPDVRSRFKALLGAFRNREILSHALDYGLNASGDNRDALWWIPFQASGFMENRPFILDWVLANADTIRADAGPMILDYLIPRLVQVRSDSLYRKAVAWAAEPSHRSQLLDVNLRKESDRLTTRLRLIERERAAVEAYLKREFGGK